jgi:hypothetical protein
LAVIAGPRAPQVRPKKQACNHRGQPWPGPVIASAQMTPTIETPFKRDLSSTAAKKVHAELRNLKLPTIEDIRDEFEGKAHELGVHAES